MERNIKIQGITLKKLNLGESNIGVTILTADDEVLFVLAYGATKSKNKLFGSVNPFVEATWDLYFDPVKEYYRAKDVEITNYNSSLQSSLENFYTATLFLEIILKIQGSQGLYNLLKESLKIIQKSENPRMVLIQFLLRLLIDQGVAPSFIYCEECGKEIIKESLFFNGETELVCIQCLKTNRKFEMNPGILKYCINTPLMDMEKAIKIGLSEQAKIDLKEFLIILTKKFTGGKLLTLNSSNGLI